MAFKPVGVDDSNLFAPRVETRLAALFAGIKARSSHTGTQTLSTISDFAAEIRKTDANVVYVGGLYPLRSTVTTDAQRRVRWIGPVAPSIGSGYAQSGLDVWEQTP